MTDLSASPITTATRPVEVLAPDPAPSPAQTRGLTRIWRPRLNEPLTGELIDRVLRARAIEPGDDAESFLNPSLRAMHDPSGIPDLDRAARRVLDAVEQGQPIIIYGDYDVDGVTASAILIHLLRTIAPAANVRSYIPHRLDEGYGLNCEAINTLADEGAALIVSVDCGITAIEPARTAKARDVDLIITDHHNPPKSLDDLPDAFAVVHPRRPDSAYPFGELCGAGVAYKLAWRMATLHCGGDRVSPACRDVLIELLAFAALGSIADIVPLVDENRVIVRHGLTLIPRSKNEGLRALIDASGLGSEKIDADAVGFRLAPRLNAIGRLGHAADALELMTDATGPRALELAQKLSRVNEDRKARELAIVTQAAEMAETMGMTGPDRRAIVLAHEDWHPGVVGIVCSRLVEKFARPTILMQRDGDQCKGSGRSIEGFNLHAGLEACADHLAGYGGHDMAAGMRCDAQNFDAFANAFIDHANANLGEDDLVHHAKYDTQTSLAELTPERVRQLDRLAPFGAGNGRVRLRVNDAKLNGPPEPFGRSGAHLSLRVGPRSGPGHTVRIVAWGWAQHIGQIPAGAPVELLIDPKLSQWNGSTRVEPVLVDLRVQ